MKKCYALLSILLALFLFSCSNENHDEIVLDDTPDSGLLNHQSQVDGVTYTLKDVAVNPDVVSLNATNSKLISVTGDVYKLEIAEGAANLLPGTVLYLQTSEATHLRIVENITVENNVFVVETSEAGLGDLFQGGSLELSVDLQKAESKAFQLKSLSYDNGLTFDIFNAVGEYQNGAFTASPNASVKAFFNVKVGFAGKLLKTPNEVVVTYELQTAFNPYLTFSKAVNAGYETDFMSLVPQNLTDLLKTIEIEVNIPLGDLGTLPAKVSIADIKFPMEVSANLSKEADLRFNANGTFKVGYAYYKNVAGKTSHQIYENTMITSSYPDLRLNGEVLSDAKIIITPNILLIDASLLKVSGDIIFGMKTETSGGIETLTQNYIGGSKGEFYSQGTLSVSSLGIRLFTTDLFKETKELWNVGAFDKTFKLSNLKIAKPSKSICALRSYNFEMTVDYRYPVMGKTVSNELVVTYDVYDDSKKLLSGGQKVTVNPYDVTANSFTFDLCVPFKIDALALTAGFTKKTGYIRNIKITDAFENEASGIYNVDNTVSYEIPLGSPYNTAFWK